MDYQRTVSKIQLLGFAYSTTTNPIKAVSAADSSNYRTQDEWYTPSTINMTPITLIRKLTDTDVQAFRTTIIIIIYYNYYHNKEIDRKYCCSNNTLALCFCQFRILIS